MCVLTLTYWFYCCVQRTPDSHKIISSSPHNTFIFNTSRMQNWISHYPHILSLCGIKRGTKGKETCFLCKIYKWGQCGYAHTKRKLILCRITSLGRQFHQCVYCALCTQFGDCWFPKEFIKEDCTHCMITWETCLASSHTLIPKNSKWKKNR